jgi:hypothetical protein
VSYMSARQPQRRRRYFLLGVVAIVMPAPFCKPVTRRWQSDRCRVLTGRDRRLQRSAPVRKTARDRDAGQRARCFARHPCERRPAPSARRPDTEADGQRQAGQPLDRDRGTPRAHLCEHISAHLVRDRARAHGDRPCTPPQAAASTRSRTRRTRAASSHPRGPSRSARLHGRHRPTRRARPALGGVIGRSGDPNA